MNKASSNEFNLCKLGTKVEVNTELINESISPSIYNIIKCQPVVEVIDYKLDASSINGINKIIVIKTVYFIVI